MNEENLKKYNAMIQRINDMPDNEIEGLLAFDLCPFEPQWMIGVPLGMFHCDCCGEMVVAGCEHPRMSCLREYRPFFSYPIEVIQWQPGDIVTRDGSDEQEIISIDYGTCCMTVKCIKEPMAFDGFDPWCRVGDEEFNLISRYDFVRRL